jgi:hypothetical protein
VFDIYFISEVFGKSFQEKYASRRTDRGAYADGLLFFSKPNRTVCSSVDRADGLRPARGQSAGPGRRSAWSWWKVLPAQQAVMPVVYFVFLPLEFKRRQSARASRTVCEVRVFHITANNGKGEYKYSMLEVGEALLAL